MRIGLPYVRRADRARDEGRWIDAILDFRRGLEWLPWRDDLRVQIGNCLKEFGDYEAAAELYTAVTQAPALYDAQKQLDDLDRRAGRPILRYRVGTLPRSEAEGDTEASTGQLSARLFPNRIRQADSDSRHWLGSLGFIDNLPVRRRGHRHFAIKFDQIAALSLEHARIREPVFTGVVAVRGRITSLRRLDHITFSLTAGALKIDLGQTLVREVDLSGILKYYVFNAWLDCADLPPGRHWFEAKVPGAAPSGTFVHVVPQTDLSAEFESSNTYVPSVTGLNAEEAVLRLPAEARPASRVFFDRPIRSILVMRADQLGDVSASLPAFARLRALFPDARITALVQPSVATIVGASGVADEVLTLTLDYDARVERRHLSVDEEARLRRVLGERGIDLAIDLCPGDETRPLLLLSGAAYLVGFGTERFGFLDFGITVRSRDKVNQLEKVSHAVTVLSLVEALGVAATPERGSVLRTHPIRNATFAERGLEAKRYVVLHTGARHALNEWPLERFVELAVAIARDTSLRVVLFMNPTAVMPPMPTDVVDRIVQAGLLDSDEFDEIISNAALVVGNDSGPKHLAAARGIPTVSIQVSRLNWDEWGQDSRGFIVVKRVPCTGCGLNDILLCGRDAICIRSISTEEVLNAVRACLAQA